MTKHILDKVIRETAVNVQEYGMADVDEVATVVARRVGLLRQEQVGKVAVAPAWLVTRVERFLEEEW